MRKFVSDFMRRGMVACGFGPIVLAVIYWILHHLAVVDTLTVKQVCIGILSLSALAFIAGGMNAVYQIERLPLMVAVLIHGIVLYISYLGTYLLNNWLAWGVTPILVFSGIFVVGYLSIWAIVYSLIKMNTNRINEILKKNHQNADGRQ